MKIYVPTKGRVGRQATLANLPVELFDDLYVVCPEHEIDAHKRAGEFAKFIAQPDPNMGISEKRKWIVDQCPDDRLVMLDDDLRFAMRRSEAPGQFRKASDEEVIRGFLEMEAMLDEETPHIGFGARGGSIGPLAERGGWQEAKRQMYVLGYHVPTVRREVIFGRVKTHEDMDVTLQLLTKGYPNLVNFSLVVDQKFGNPGGCTDERSDEVNEADCLLLQAAFPQFVKVKKKEYYTSKDRVEVICYWQKALDHGLQIREQRESS